MRVADRQGAVVTEEISRLHVRVSGRAQLGELIELVTEAIGEDAE